MKPKITPQQFRETIESYVANGELTYVEALVLFAENNGIEVQTVARMLSRNAPLKAKVEEQCSELKMIR